MILYAVEHVENFFMAEEPTIILIQDIKQLLQFFIVEEAFPIHAHRYKLWEIDVTVLVDVTEAHYCIDFSLYIPGAF